MHREGTTAQPATMQRIVAGTTVWSMPEGLTWLPALYVLELAAGHAVPPDEAPPRTTMR